MLRSLWYGGIAEPAGGAQSHLDVADGDRSKVVWRCYDPYGMEAFDGAVVSPDISLGPLGGCMLDLSLGIG